jgi:LPS export ABC transporter permease LptF/LPS export ABC transporter permease LptG
MRLLDKYICREVGSHALLGFAVFTFVLFVPKLITLMDLIVRHSSGAGTVALLFLCLLPPALIFTIPMAVLVGVLIGLGRLSADSEIVALHASGIGLRRLLAPIGLLALACSFVTLVITFWVSPASVRTLHRLQEEILASQAPFAVEPRVFDERFPHIILYVRDVEAAATHWSGVFLSDSGAENGSTITVAQDAQIFRGAQKDQLELHLGAGSTHEYNPSDPSRYNVTTFGESDIPVEISSSAATPRNPTLSKAELPVSALLSDRGPTWRDSRVEFQNRIALPAACLVFALLGVPVGVRPRRGGRAAGLILTLALIGGYYFLYVSGDHFARQGKISPILGIWAANIVSAIIGLVFLRRIESIRRPNRVVVWVDSLLWKLRRKRRVSRPSALVENGKSLLEINGARAANGASAGNGSSGSETNGEAAGAQPALSLRKIQGAGSPAMFPMLIDFYVLQRFFYFFFVLLLAFVVIFDAFTLFDLLADISKNHVAVSTVIKYFGYLIPYMLYTLAPLAVLVATLVTLAVLAKNNEVIAFKASGVSLYRLVLPLSLAGILVAVGMFSLGETYLPYADQRQDALRNEIKGRPPQTFYQPTHQWIFGENEKIYNYELFDPVARLFGGLNVFELDPQTFQIRRRVYASRASWDPEENTWILTGGWVRDFDTDRVVRYTPFTAYSLPELTEPPSYFRREVLQSDQMNWHQLGEYIRSLRQAGFDTSRLSVQWYEKFAFPLIAAIIVLLGAPFAFLTGTRGAIGGIAVAIGIGIVYRATAALLESMGTAGLLPPLLAGWAPDAIFGFLAAYFFLKMPT